MRPGATAEVELRTRWRWAVLAVGLGLSGCGEGGTTSATAPAVVNKPVALKGTPKIALIRLGDQTTPAEPTDKDVEAGLNQDGVSPSAVKITTFEAKGDRAALAKLVDDAIADGAELLMPLGAEATLAVFAKDPKVPVVFAMTSEPTRLGLAKTEKDHAENITGAFSAADQSLIVPIARGSLTKATTFGILFCPDNPVSVAHKDALLACNWDTVQPVTAEYHAESEIPAAVRSLVEKKAQAIFLTHGIGKGARAAVEEATKAKVASFGFLADHGKAGAIVSRATQARWAGFEAGRRAARVLKGEPVKQIPLVRGDNYTTIVNTDAAKDLGVTILGAIMRDPVRVKTE